MSSELTAGEGLAADSAVLRSRAERRAAVWSGVSFLRGEALLSIVVPVLLFVLWVVATDRHWMSPQVLPTPALVVQTARELLSDNLLSNLAISLQRLLIGLTAGVVAGAALGAWIGLSRKAEAIIYPTFIAVVQVPTLAWVPFFMMIFGLGEALKIVVIVKAVITPIVIYTHIGIRDTDARLLEAARVLRLPVFLRLTRVIAPASLPAFMTGLRLALAQGWTSLLAVELLASSEGIGFLMVWGRQLFQLDIVFVCIFVIGLVGLLMDRGLQELDRVLVTWPRPALAQHRDQDSGWSRDRLIEQTILPVSLLLIWGLASWHTGGDASLLPSPWSVGHVLAQGLGDGSLGYAMLLSLRRAFIGLLIGGGAGFVVGLVMGLVPTAYRLLHGTLTILRLVAIFAWIPLLTAWVGLGEAAKLSFVAIASFFPMQLATQRGVANLPLPLIEAARTMRLSLPARLRYLVLPGMAPSVFAGFRLTLLQAWIGVMGAEYFMPSSGGIGSLMIDAQQLFRIDVVVAAMILVGIVAAILNWLGRVIEARATNWRQA